MADGNVVDLVDVSEHMKHWSVLQMLEFAVQRVKENPEAFSSGYLLMRENEPDGGWSQHHSRAGFIDSMQSLGFLQVGIAYRIESVRGGSD